MDQIRVIIADGDPRTRKLLVLHLRESNFEVEIANDVDQTIELLGKRNGAYDVVVLDDRLLRGRDELDVTVTRRMRAFFPNVRIIMLCSFGLDIGPEAFQDGVFRYISRPCSITQLIAYIRDAADARQFKLESEKQRTFQIKILFLAANPIDSVRLRLDEEIRAIDMALRQTEFRDRFEIEQHWAVRATDLQNYLLRHKPHIVHFSGHGSSSNEIMLEDNFGRSQPVSVRALSNLFSALKDNIQCVILNACYSEQQAIAIAEHIDCVIGMSKSIEDLSAISFGTAFYQALGYGRDVKTAFNLGCMQIDLENLGELNIPKLLAQRKNPQTITFVFK